jgi:hypothetical protein
LELDKENVNLVGYYAMFLQKAKKDLSGRCGHLHLTP